MKLINYLIIICLFITSFNFVLAETTFTDDPNYFVVTNYIETPQGTGSGYLIKEAVGQNVTQSIIENIKDKVESSPVAGFIIILIIIGLLLLLRTKKDKNKEQQHLNTMM